MRSLLLVLAALSCVAPAAAQDKAIRVSGSPADGRLIARLEAGFRQSHPGQRFTDSLHGPESTLAGIYTGTADVAFMARELREPMERMAYEWAMLQPPLALEIATGGITKARPSDQLGIFVNVANPVAKLDLAQLGAIFGADHAASGWSEVGGPTARPIHAYGVDVESTDALFFRRSALHDSRKWRATYRAEPDARAALAAVAADPDGITFAPVAEARPGVRLVAITDAAGAAVLPTAADIQARRYPLLRVVKIVVAHDKGAPVAPATRAFAAFLLSPEGQAILADDGAYFPLPPAEAARQRGLLDATQ